MGATIMATTRVRSGQGGRESRGSKPRRRKVPRTAKTWPWGRERCTCKVSEAATRGSPLRRRRKDWIWAAGQAERLARGRLTTLPFRRKDSGGGVGRSGWGRIPRTWVYDINIKCNLSIHTIHLHGYAMQFTAWVEFALCR